MFPNKESEKGPMTPKGEVCNGSVGGAKQSVPGGPPRSGRYGNDMDYSEVNGRTSGIPDGPPRSGRYGG